jgi:hypothetical protein
MPHEASELAPNDELFPAQAELDRLTSPGTDRAVRRLGRVRIPLALPYRPWARAYRLPDGRVVWTVRLWESDRPVRRCVPTDTLRAYCRSNRLPAVEAAIDAILAAAAREGDR